MHYGKWPENEIDHINHDGLDNRRSNLRICSHLQNGRNVLIQRNNKSGFKGVSFYKTKKKNPWQAQIRSNGKKIHIGYSPTRLEAAKAYNETVLRLHGDFAQPNILEGTQT